MFNVFPVQRPMFFPVAPYYKPQHQLNYMNRFLSPIPFYQSQCIAVLRIITGIFLIYHGKEVFDAATMQEYANWDKFKGSQVGTVLVYMGKGAEFVAGLLLLLGLLTRIAALILIVTMLYIAFFVGTGKIWYEDQHPFMFALMGVLFLFSGGSTWSLDRKFFANR